MIGWQMAHRCMGTIGLLAVLLPTATMAEKYVYVNDLTASSHLQGPQRVIIGPDGCFYVTASDSGRVVIYDAEGNSGGSWTIAGTAGAPSRPTGIAFGLGEDVFVTDTAANTLIRLNREGEEQQRWREFDGAAPPTLSQPRAIAVDRDGKILIADTGNKRVLILKPDGTYHRQWDRLQLRPYPYDLLIQGNRVYVLQSGLHSPGAFVRGYVFRYHISDGHYLGRLKEGIDNPEVMTRDSQGCWYLGGSGPIGLGNFWGIIKLTKNGNDDIAYISDRHSGGPPLTRPVGVAVDERGLVYAIGANGTHVSYYQYRPPKQH